MIVKHECKCKKSSIEIDDNETNVCCGIIGIVSVKDSGLKNGIVFCGHCHLAYFTQPK